MGKVSRFLAWPAAEKLLVVKAWLLLAGVRGLLFITRYDRTHSWLRRYHREPDRRSRATRPSAARIARIVEIAADWIPGGSHCLTRGLVAEFFLVRRGYPAALVIGVAKDDTGKLIAHAWVDCDGTILIGDGPELERYTRLQGEAPAAPSRH